jgi:hypothetical protein
MMRDKLISVMLRGPSNELVHLEIIYLKANGSLNSLFAWSDRSLTFKNNKQDILIQANVGFSNAES